MASGRNVSSLAIACLAVFALAKPAAAQMIPDPKFPPPSDVTARDHPNDKGEKIDVEWKVSPVDKPETAPRTVLGYVIERTKDPNDGWVKVGAVEYGATKFVDSHARRGTPYLYRVAATGQNVLSNFVATTEPATAAMQWFDGTRGWFFLIVVLICAAIIGFILAARAGISLKVRRIAGLEVVDEAVGRATEMGKTCLFVPGIQDLTEIETVAGITVLSRVAKTAAEYDATVEVPTSRSLVMTAARETMQASYLAAGRPDAYDENRIYYVTDEQFGYVAYLTGLMVREKPAACFYMGSFFAESLMLAETGNSIGAIQVAGSAQPAQLPFFVAACDYTLIGEEFFAASAYLSGEPNQLGSLKGQDCGKVIVAAMLLAGCLLATLVSFRMDHGKPAEGWPEKALGYYTKTVLDAGGER